MVLPQNTTVHWSVSDRRPPTDELFPDPVARLIPGATHRHMWDRAFCPCSGPIYCSDNPDKAAHVTTIIHGQTRHSSRRQLSQLTGAMSMRLVNILSPVPSTAKRRTPWSHQFWDISVRGTEVRTLRGTSQDLVHHFRESGNEYVRLQACSVGRCLTFEKFRGIGAGLDGQEHHCGCSVE